MDTVVKKLYEGLFLVDSGQAAADWDAVNQAISTVLERGQAEIVSMKKWDERRLAYEVEGKNRGTYILCYFRAPSDRIGGIEKDVQLSEQIIRVLVLRGDHLSEDDINSPSPTELAEAAAAEAAARAAARAAEKEASEKEASEKEAAEKKVAEKKSAEKEAAAKEAAEKETVVEEAAVAAEPDEQASEIVEDTKEPAPAEPVEQDQGTSPAEDLDQEQQEPK